MTTVPDEDEYIHEDYPRDDETPWKENWYFNFIDKENNAWGFNHISLERHKNRGRFCTMHVVDGETFKYLEYFALSEDFTEINDGKLHLEFLEPHKKFRLRFDGPNHSIDLNYRGRFDVFDYDHDRGKNKPKGDKKSLAVHHYEQALTVTGTLTKDGVKRDISCFGHRDHSWGYRNEMNISAWNWIAAQFADKTINLMLVRIKDFSGSRGFISDANGNTTITKVEVVSTERNAQDEPANAVYKVTDENGKTFSMASEVFSTVSTPPGEDGAGDTITVYENFSHFTLLESGEKGIGIDEYLENSEG